MTPRYTIRRDYGPHGWGYVGNDVCDTQADAMDAVYDSFHGETVVADLATVEVTLMNDAGHRDVTEDVLRAIGARLSDGWQPGDAFPDAFLKWADPDIQEAAADAAEEDYQRDHRGYAREDAA